MVNYQGAPLQEQIKYLLEKNLEYSKEIYSVMKKIHRYIVLGRILSVIYIILIVGPLILGIIFLPNIFRNSLNSIMPGGLEQNINVQDLIKSGNIFENYQDVLDLQESQ